MIRARLQLLIFQANGFLESSSSASSSYRMRCYERYAKHLCTCEVLELR
jgi:hypothetical protein